MQALSEVKRKNDSQIAYKGPLEIISTSEDYLGNVMSDLSYNLSPGDTTVVVTNGGATDFTILVPPPSEAEGKTYVVRASISSTGNVIVDDNDDAIDNDALPKTLGTNNDYIILLCQTGKWFILDSEVD